MLRVPGRLRRLLRPVVRAESVLQALRNLPRTDCRTLVRAQPVLVLAPHPDDESLGCGGLLAACQEHGLDAYVIVLTDGTASHPGSREYPPARLATTRASEARSAIRALGLDDDRIEFLGLPDGRAPTRGKHFGAVVSSIASYARARRVGTICTTWLHDPHPDHRAAYHIGLRVAREIGARLLCYPVWGWTVPPDAWLPAMKVSGACLDIARHLAAKRRAIACHRSQYSNLIRDDPTAFRLSPDVLALFDRPFEVFCEAPDAG
jgi:LmbE family N-acetylglucosaminyl deacetylase